MVKTKYKVRGLNNMGKVIHRTVTLETPEFKEKTHEFEGHTFTTTVLEQFDNYPINEGIDFRDHIKQQDMDIVLDWEVVTEKNQVSVIKRTFDNTLATVQESANLDDELVANIAAVYYNMKDVINHLPMKDQFMIVLKGVDVAGQSALHAYKSINNLFKDFDENVEQKKLETGRVSLTKDELRELREKNK